MSTFRELRTAEPLFTRNPPSSGTTNVLSPTEGAITLAGLAPSIVLILAAVVGAVTISGNAPSLTTQLQGVQGSVVIGGNAPTVSVANVLLPTEGSILIGGQAPILSSTIQAVDGAVVISGNAPALTEQLQATEGAVVIDGNVPSITQFGGSVLSPTEGNIALVGEVPGLIQTSSSAPSTGSGGGGRYFGYYPEREREIRAEIRSITKEKKRIERRFKLAPNNVDLARLAALLTELQQRLDALVTEYADLTQRSVASQDEDEEFLVSIFSESFYD